MHVSDGTTALWDHTIYLFFKLCITDANMSRKDLKDCLCMCLMEQLLSGIILDILNCVRQTQICPEKI